MQIQQAEGFLAIPETGKGPGVLVLHAWWGLNETVKEVYRRLALEGFTAFAPNLYHGQIATTIEEAERLSGALNEGQARADVAAAAQLAWKRTMIFSEMYLPLSRTRTDLSHNSTPLCP